MHAQGHMMVLLRTMKKTTKLFPQKIFAKRYNLKAKNVFLKAYLILDYICFLNSLNNHLLSSIEFLLLE